MTHIGPHPSRHGLDIHGFRDTGTIYWHLPASRLYEEAIRRGEAVIGPGGPLLADTGIHTGRSPNDKFVVEEPSSKADIWWGPVNRPADPEVFDRLLAKVQGYLVGKELFVFDGYAGADPEHRLRVRVINENAWQNLFARNMFVREENGAQLEDFHPEFTVVHVPGFLADPQVDGTRSSTFILLHLGKKMVLVGGTEYAGEIKKSIFTVMNYRLPKRGVMAMHCSANFRPDPEGGEPRVALF
ncbi:MAG: phosphoenolpyruvate carboxykinase (ATP), partial [Holophagales bacterium]|nr:phosphoenolpyruvate carboxykinase (ATP) [Holophagales bacterium]